MNNNQNPTHLPQQPLNIPPINPELSLEQQQQLQTQSQFQQKQSLIEKVNTTASGVFDYLKTKANTIPGKIPGNFIPKNLLSENLDPLTILTEISPENFYSVLEKNIKEIQCQKLLKTSLNDLTVLSYVTNPKQINNSLFSTSYVLYDVSTPQFNWLVNRRYSDFIWLRECLQSLFPADLMPCLPKKKIGNRRFEEDFLKKRTQGLQNFLNEIIKIEKYKSTEPLTIFLSCMDRNMFEQQMKRLSPKVLIHQTTPSLGSIEGKIKVLNLNQEFSSDTISYFNQISTYFTSQTDILNQINTSLKKYNNCMKDAYKHLEDVENNFSKLVDYIDKVNLSPKMSKTYEQYEVFFKNWKRIQLNQTCIIKDLVNKFFKNIKNKSEAFIEIIYKQQMLQDEYQTMRNKLFAKKELLWQQMDISKWDLNQLEPIDTTRLYRDKPYAQEKMCFKETLELDVKGDFLGYYYYKIHHILLELIKDFNFSYLENITDFTNQIQPTLTDGITVWSSIVSNIPK